MWRCSVQVSQLASCYGKAQWFGLNTGETTESIWHRCEGAIHRGVHRHRTHRSGSRVISGFALLRVTVIRLLCLHELDPSSSLKTRVDLGGGRPSDVQWTSTSGVMIGRRCVSENSLSVHLKHSGDANGDANGDAYACQDQDQDQN